PGAPLLTNGVSLLKTKLGNGESFVAKTVCRVWKKLSVTGLGEVDQRKVCTTVLSRQLVQQRFGLLKIGGVKALGEPALDGGQQRTGFGALALLLPEARQAHGGAQLQRLRLLAAGDV